MRPIVVAFVVQSCLSLTSTVHSVQNNVPSAQQLSSGIKKLPDIFWNTTNPIFRIDNTDNIIDVNRGRVNMMNEYDQVNIICPLYDKNVTPDKNDTEQFIIYSVNRDEYDMCNVMRARPRVIAHCNRPYSPTFFTISFRSFSPTPGAMEFHAGQDYYFISTSSKENVYEKNGGMCRTHNMKIVFKVAEIHKPALVKSTPEINKVHNDNQVTPPLTNEANNAIDEAENKDDLSDSSKDKKERRRRRKKNKERQRVNKLTPDDVDNNNSITPPQGSELSSGDYDNAKWRQKDSGYVERVNNLMKQEASIGGYGGINDANSVNLLTNFGRLLIMVAGWFLVQN